jgi:2-(1,2-epoxy-1,2-dihydrophenyl)acetyl-CoA isomerase
VGSKVAGETVRTRYCDGVAHVLLDRPADANALDLEMARAFLGTLRAAEQRPDIRVLTITGAAHFFCGGGDVKAMASAVDKPAFLRELADAAHEVMLAMAQSRLFLIAAVNGPAAGAGLGLVLNADYVVASEHARFRTAYAALGLTPDSGVSYLLPRAVGHQRAMELLLVGRELSAQEAAEWGLVNEAVAPEALQSRVEELSETLAARSSSAWAVTKRLANLELIERYRAHLAEESSQISRMASLPDAQARIARFGARD